MITTTDTPRTISAHIHFYGKPDVDFTAGNLFLQSDGGWCVIGGATPTELEQLAHQILDAVRDAQ